MWERRQMCVIDARFTVNDLFLASIKLFMYNLSGRHHWTIIIVNKVVFLLLQFDWMNLLWLFFLSNHNHLSTIWVAFVFVVFLSNYILPILCLNVNSLLEHVLLHFILSLQLYTRLNWNLKIGAHCKFYRMEASENSIHLICVPVG